MAAGALYFKMKPGLAHREPIAIHEAGHFIAHIFFGHRVESAEVGEEYGYCKLRAQDVDPFDYIIALCAGKAAVDRWYGWKRPGDEENWRKSKDHAMAYRAALKVSGDDHESAALLMQWAEKRADVIVKERWSPLEQLAHALVEKGKLTVRQSR